MVFRIYIEKKKNFANEANTLLKDIIKFLQIDRLTGLRIINRYDCENIDEKLFKYAINTVFSEPQTDVIIEKINIDCENVFAVEYLPGQFDQRANSAAECIQIISKSERPIVKTGKIYMLYGKLSLDDVKAIKKYVINPVEATEATLKDYKTLNINYKIPSEVDTLIGFGKYSDVELIKIIKEYKLAMDFEDLLFCQNYFLKEKRDPTITEIKVIDTYWSDHCRHTTFNTSIDNVKFEDQLVQSAYDEYIKTRKELGRTKPINLMDIGTIATKYLKKIGKMNKLDESEEINACTVKIDVNVDGKMEKWLLLFKNETHNHPTEIEPFGGAATCIGGAIRDPLSGRSYVYAAMRITGAANPLKPVSETLEGKLPQRKIVTTAASGYSSYGNQIGLATGQVDEIYHDGYIAKRMEVGAVIGAVPEENVRRERPINGDIVVLLGGKTGRDGCGGATGSSKSHTLESLELCGAEVQKGNAPEERKIQRLFRNSEATKLIKRCNDFGAGGVSVAIGELADGLEIDLNAVPKKYEGLDGTELAISESQERMAVVVAKEQVNKFCNMAFEENLEATVVAEVKDKPYLIMKWNGKDIVNISREFLDTNGAEKHIKIEIPKHMSFNKKTNGTFSELYEALASDLNICSKRGLSERFDSTIGAGTVLMPFGGKKQRTPIQAMVNKLPVLNGNTDTCSIMSWGYNPYIAEKSPYHSAYLAVVESVSKLIATGANFEDVYLTLQEYFEKPGTDGKRWGKPLAAVLGAFMAEKELGIAAIGGKDSMSGTFENYDVPPTLISFAITTDEAKNIISPEFKSSGHNVVIVKPKYNKDGLPTGESLKKIYREVNELIKSKKIVSAYTPTFGGFAEAILKMSMGNGIGFSFDENIDIEDIFGYNYGAFILELSGEDSIGFKIGTTNNEETFTYCNETIEIDSLFNLYENKLETVYNCNIEMKKENIDTINYISDEHKQAIIKVLKPKVLIPVFPGTNCEYDSAKAFADAGADPEIFVINNLSTNSIVESIEAFAEKVKKSQIILIPGGFSGGDEPDGSGKFITAFFRNTEIKRAIMDLIDNRDGLILGICNGFQALIKLGLVPYGKIIDTDENCPTLTLNKIGRHQSKLVRVRVASNKSPWLANAKVGDIYTVPISHSEGRFIANDKLIYELGQNGQIITQYVNDSGEPTSNIQYNPNGSYEAIEGITSPDGRILGKMGHVERIGENLYKNVYGEYDMKLFKSAVEYFSK